VTLLAPLEVAQEALPSYRPLALAANAVGMALVLGLVGWGLFARLDAAIVATGVLHADSERKTVEHLEGGILDELLVQPGDVVSAGQAVARLDDTQTRERLVQLKAERRDHLFTIWRLEAESRGLEPRREAAPGREAGIDGKERDRLTAEAYALFIARRSAHRAAIEALRRQIAQSRGRISANLGQADAAAAQLSGWSEEHEMVAKLVERGAAARKQLLDLERAMAALRGDRLENLGLVEASRQDIERARSEIEALEQRRQAEISAELAEARGAVDRLNSQIRAARDVLARHVLRAPQSGRVVEVATVTPGAVIGSGDPLMEILPANDRLVALLRLSPDTIDTVHVGVPAKVRLTAYKRLEAPVLDGHVRYVSADLLEAPENGEAYFEVRVVLDRGDVAGLHGAEITAGMPVEVTLTTGERRAGEYLLEPILRHLRHAFKDE